MNFKERLVTPNRSQGLWQNNYYIWCGSVIGDGKGTYHMFASRWEMEKTFWAWVTSSRIVRAISDKPEGPFHVVEELSVLNEQEWSRKMAHNPTVVRFGEKYYLYYTGTTYSDSSHLPTDAEQVRSHPARFNQRIGVAYADSPEGPWTPSSRNPVLEPRDGNWDSTYVTNPSVFVESDNEIRLIYKAKYSTDNRLVLGLAVSYNPEGPFQRRGPSPLFQYDVEDPFIWKEKGDYWMLAKDMTGELTGKADGVLFRSDDGLNWDLAENAFAYDRTIEWSDGTKDHFRSVERPQLLIEDGKAVCLYNAVGDRVDYTANIARRINN